jgi:hypothetical protein
MRTFWNMGSKYVDDLPSLPEFVTLGWINNSPRNESESDDDSCDDIDSECCDTESDEETQWTKYLCFLFRLGVNKFRVQYWGDYI